MFLIIFVYFVVSGVQLAPYFSTGFGLGPRVVKTEVRGSVYRWSPAGCLSVSVSWCSSYVELEGCSPRTTVGTVAAVGPKYTVGSGRQVILHN